ncbi:swr1 complex component [Lobaria immixta]|nr:swr1 complex component [Lobaria immixta]
MTEMQNGSPDNNNGFTDHHLNDQRVGSRFSTPINTAQVQTPDSLTGQTSLDNEDLDCEDNDNDAPPTKKRKLTDHATRQSSTSTSRPISPPWKRIAVDGPTSFVEGGRRKSSRTNFVPLELQPPAEKRQTRAAIQKTHLTKTRLSGTSTQKSSSSTPAANQPQINAKRPQSSGKSTGVSAGKSPTKANQQTPIPSLQAPAAPAPVKRSHKKKVPPLSPISSPKVTTSPKTRRSLRTSEATETLHNGRVMRTKRCHESQIEDDDNNDDAGNEEEEEEEEEEPVLVGPNYKPQRLNLRVRMPTVKIQHPEHVTLPPRFASFREWFEQEGSLAEDGMGRMTDQEAKDEADLRRRIVRAARPGGPLSEGKCSAHLPDTYEGPPRLYLHWDHLIRQAEYFQKLMEAEQKAHRAMAKKFAYAAAAEWKRKQPKTQKEIDMEQMAAQKAVHAGLLKALMHKWETVTAEVERRRRQRWEEEQQRLGKQALNKVLEQSTQLLFKSRLRPSSDANSDDEEGETLNESGGSSSGAESEDEDNMSSSQSNSEDAEANNECHDDEGLTLEELRQKYAGIPDTDPNQQNTETRKSEDIDVDPGGADTAFDRTDHSPPAIAQNDSLLSKPNSHEREPSVAIDEVDDILLDDSDASTDMDDETDDGSGQSTSDEDGGESEAVADDCGLLGFFSKKDYQVDESTVVEDTLHASAKGEDSDEVEEVSLIPDATQVQTPSASNSEEPFSETRNRPKSLTTNNIVQMDQPPSHSNLRKSVAEPSPVPSPTPSASALQKHPDSLPTTPVSTNPLKTQVPSLLRGTLREYQHFGLDWLAGLYANRTNGILADEMGLGKTIQTIALLAHVAVEHEVWGPHLIVVPTSVILNWEMEFKKFLPGFKVMTYYGNQEERKEKRKGWTDIDKHNVWITSYQIVLADNQIFKRRSWHYMVLDEAHNIKNFRSQRWQTLLMFKTRSRLLLTGTPLQNNLTELWSLLFFLMPIDSNEKGISGFADLQEFSNWFRKPVEQILEHGRDTMDDDAKAIITKLHKVLRPYLLRRLKADVEKQMPGKYEHVVYCRLSKRQRYLYDGFMSRAQTRDILASGNYLTIINCLMQLRKVCNHPDLFETREIVTSFAMPKSAVADFEIKELLVRRRLLQEDPISKVDLGVVNLCPGSNEHLSALDTIQKQRLGALGALRQLTSQQWKRIEGMHSSASSVKGDQGLLFDGSSVKSTLASIERAAQRSRFEELRHSAYLTSLRSQRRPLYSYSLMERLRMDINSLSRSALPSRRVQLVERYLNTSSALTDMVPTLAQRSVAMKTTIQKFGCVTPKVVATGLAPLVLSSKGVEAVRSTQNDHSPDAFHEARMCLSIAFPDKRLLQYDCGKLQKLDSLLRELQAGGHRALIFTQMTRVLDILEQFLNIHGHRYLRLDGSTKIEQRQILTDRFNNDTRILAFILSSRSGGLGINLTGADAVIFYDLDWNPAMDKQCQDRCHRIGQTRDVHIYRFVSEYTIEANILKKSNQKRMLDDVVIQEGEFTTDYFNKPSIHDMLDDSALMDGDVEASAAMDRVLGTHTSGVAAGKAFEQAEDQEDIAAARIAEREMVQIDAADFEEKAAPGTTGGAASLKTSMSQDQHGVMPPPDAAPVTHDAEAGPATPGTRARASPEVEENDDEGEPGDVEDYMIRHLEWELRDVPVLPPADKKGSKRSKKAGGEHRVRRQR